MVNVYETHKILQLRAGLVSNNPKMVERAIFEIGDISQIKIDAKSLKDFYLEQYEKYNIGSDTTSKDQILELLTSKNTKILAEFSQICSALIEEYLADKASKEKSGKCDDGYMPYESGYDSLSDDVQLDDVRICTLGDTHKAFDVDAE